MRYHYVIATPTTFTTYECHAALRSLLILLLRLLPLVLEKNLFVIFYYVHYGMVMSKRSKILFQRYVHDAMIMKNIRFTVGFVKNTLINCYYVDYAAIMTKKYIFSFQYYYIHYTV